MIKKRIDYLKVDIYFCETEKEVNKVIRDDIGDVGFECDFSRAHGATFINGNNIVIWMGDKILSSLSHECFHASVEICKSIGSTPEDEVESAAWLNAWLFKTYLEEIWEISDEQ